MKTYLEAALVVAIATSRRAAGPGGPGCDCGGTNICEPCALRAALAGQPSSLEYIDARGLRDPRTYWGRVERLAHNADPAAAELAATLRRRDVVSALGVLASELDCEGGMELAEQAAEQALATPIVGGGATIHLYSDCHACTVIAVNKKGTKVSLQRDTAKLLNAANSGEPDALSFAPGGFVGHTSGVQRWTYKRNPEGSVRHFSRRANGRWVEVGSSAKTGPSATIGAREEHYDFNF